MRLLAYLWAFPMTAIGLCFALVAILSGGSVGRRGGVIEVAGGLVGFVLRGNRHWCGFLHG